MCLLLGCNSDRISGEQNIRQIVALIRLGAVRNFRTTGTTNWQQMECLSRDVLATVAEGTVVEDYPDYGKGSCVLVLQQDRRGEPMHVVWGIPKGASSPAVLVTAYRPIRINGNPVLQGGANEGATNYQLVHEGTYVAEVEVETIYADDRMVPLSVGGGRLQA